MYVTWSTGHLLRDEQGFTGVSGGNDKDCRQPMFIPKLLTTFSKPCSLANNSAPVIVNQQYPLCGYCCARLVAKQHAALRDGGQFERFSHPTDGLCFLPRPSGGEV